jgi:hypothetical protein
MAYEPKPGSFSLFKNDRKEKDTHPDYTGNGVLPDGTAAWINAWLKEANGKKFFSIQIKPKEQRPDDFRGSDRGGGTPVAGRGGSAGNAFDADDTDSIPFVTSESLW